MTSVAADETSLTDISANAWPMNAWYVAAWDHEVDRKLLARNVAGHPVVLYRTIEGEPVALADACWHRLVPLSLGRLCGNDVQCGYHGIRYDGDGKCTFMPAQETINPSAAVHSYPVVRRHCFVWVWPGDPTKANPDLIPDLKVNDDPSWAGGGRMMEVQANYQLLLDNLMDLTHEEFIHTSSIGSDALSVTPFDTVHSGNSVTVTRLMPNIVAPPFLQKLLNIKYPDYDGLVDRWQVIHYTAPTTIAIDVGVAKAGTGGLEGDRSQGISGWVLNTMTPTGPKSSMYHWAFKRDVGLDDSELTANLVEATAAVFSEDKAMLNAQQVAIDANPSYAFYNLNIDAGAMWVRRALQKMVDAEVR